MAGEFLVNPDSLEKDAKTWTEWSGDLAAITESVPTIDVLAFSILPNAAQVAAAYGRVASALRDSIDSGVLVFDGIALTLTTSSKAYAEAEDLNIQDIAKALESL
jgi:hypothetical protein